MIHFRIVTSMQRASDQQTDQPTGLSMDPLIDLQAGTALKIHHLIPDQISETTMGTRVRTARTGIASTDTATETEGTKKVPGLIREIIVSKTGMATIKTEIGLTTGED